MTVTVLRLGTTAPSVPPDGDTRVISLPALPSRAELEPALAAAEPDAGLVVTGDVAGLSTVLTRLHRGSALDRTPLGWVPAADSMSRQFAESLGLPADAAAAWWAAVEGSVRPLILVRDDQGGLLLHHATVTAANGGELGVQAYHDDHLAADGRVLEITARPAYDLAAASGPVDAVHVAVRRRRRIGPARVDRSVGRAIQLACDEATVVVDGTPHPRPLVRRTWYSDYRARWLLRGSGMAPG